MTYKPPINCDYSDEYGECFEFKCEYKAIIWDHYSKDRYYLIHKNDEVFHLIQGEPKPSGGVFCESFFESKIHPELV
jgi:hypothetical protein